MPPPATPPPPRPPEPCAPSAPSAPTVALGTSSALLAGIAVAAGNAGSTGLAFLASFGAMVSAATGWLAWRSVRGLADEQARLARAAGEQEGARESFRVAVAQLGAVTRLRDTEAGAADREQNLQKDRERILRVVAEAAQLAVGADRVVFYEYVPAPDRLIARSGPGAPVGAVLPSGSGLAGAAASTRTPVMHPGPVALAAPEPERPTGMAVPFFSRNSLLGVVAVYGRGPHAGSKPFGADDLAALHTLVTQAGTAVENISLHVEAQRLSITDGLTGLWNRRQLELRCQEELERGIRFGRPLGVVFCDIDKFKDINSDADWLHPGGDAVLVEIARRLASATREIDVVARYGGEEFVMLLPETDLEGSLVLAEKVRRSVAEEPMTYGPFSRTVTMSFGVASYPHSGSNVRTLLKAAAAALKTAKDSGRNRVEQAEPNIRKAPGPPGSTEEAALPQEEGVHEQGP